MSSFFPLLLLASIIIVWYQSVTSREQAIQLGKRLCAERELQLLDDTVALSSIRPRWINFNIYLERIYRFEYSLEGDDREGGQICLLGRQVLWIHLENQRTWYN